MYTDRGSHKLHAVGHGEVGASGEFHSHRLGRIAPGIVTRDPMMYKTLLIPLPVMCHSSLMSWPLSGSGLYLSVAAVSRIVSPSRSCSHGSHHSPQRVFLDQVAVGIPSNYHLHPSLTRHAPVVDYLS